MLNIEMWILELDEIRIIFSTGFYYLEGWDYLFSGNLTSLEVAPAGKRGQLFASPAVCL